VKKLLLIIVLLCISSVFTARASSPDTLISCHFNKVSFREFCDFINRETSVIIYYQDVWVDSLTVTIDEDKIMIKSAVEKALKGTRLEVSVWNNNLLILPGEKLPARLPDSHQNANPSHTEPG